MQTPQNKFDSYLGLIKVRPSTKCVTPTGGFMRELPIDKWSHTRQIARVVELADTAALEVVN